jgi:hypothetical protein
VITSLQRSAPNLRVYLVLVVIGVVAGLIVGHRVHGIFACPASDYAKGRYVAYCGVQGYGDYDHGAFWFNLEPDALAAARKAEVIFLGNSRLQLGFAGRSTSDWFKSQGHSYYLLGFAYEEKMAFATELLGKLKPSPRAVVINLDKFFNEELSDPADYVLHDAGARDRYRMKQLLQRVHRPVCEKIPAICGNDYAFYKDVQTGAFYRAGGKITPAATSTVSEIEEERLRSQIALARPFIEKLGVPSSCLVLTLVPFHKAPLVEARALAAALRLKFISPDTPGLQTSDGGHLDLVSAERWSADFFREAGPVLTECLANRSARAPG